jgi:DNA-binding MarR family transcriptional regulator
LNDASGRRGLAFLPEPGKLAVHGNTEERLIVTKLDMAVDKDGPEDAGDIGEINEILGFHIRLAHGTAYRHFMQSFKSLGMTQKQVSVLWLVSDHPGIAQAELSKRLQLDRATVMAIVNRLAGRKYLVRGESQTDGRMQTLKLLPAGVKALQEAKRAIRSHEKWLTGRFSARELKTLVALLRKIHG